MLALLDMFVTMLDVLSICCIISPSQEHFCQELILSLTRKAGVPSPGSSNILKTPSAGLLHESRSGALLAEQRIFKLAELFAKQFLK